MRAAFGYTTAEIDGLTFPEYEEICRYWADHPPLHKMVAAYLGMKPKSTPKTKGNLEELAGLFPDGALKPHG